MTTPTTCAACTPVTATDDAGNTAVAIRYCPTHRAASRDRLAAARATNPEVDAVHALLALSLGGRR